MNNCNAFPPAASPAPPAAPPDAETEWEGYPGIAHDFNECKRERDRLAAALADAQQALDKTREYAQRARNAAAAPDYDEENIRVLLWCTVAAALAGSSDERQQT